MKYHVFISGHWGNDFRTLYSKKDLREYLKQHEEIDVMGIIRGGQEISTDDFEFTEETVEKVEE